MLELHYPTVTKTILERQYPGKPTLKVAFGNDNGAIFENSSKLRASLFVTSGWPRSYGQTNYQVHHPRLVGSIKCSWCPGLLQPLTAADYRRRRTFSPQSPLIGAALAIWRESSSALNDDVVGFCLKSTKILI